MKRRNLLKLAALSVVAGTLSFGPAAAQDTVKIGIVGPKTGPLAAGAAVTHFPNFELWAHEINEAGGLKLKDGQKKIELIVYDDKTQPGETIKAIERLATQDEADLIMAPYGTGFNVAVAPTFAKYGYPQIAQAAVTEQRADLIEKFPNLFVVQGSTQQFVETTIAVLKKMKDDGEIGNRIAMVNIADTFGIELANVARPKFPEAGFEIVYDTSYPLGTQDLAPVIKAAKEAKPDAFVAWSYPPDTFGLAEAARIEQLNVKVYYSAVGTAFPAFKQVLGDAAENILGAGGTSRTPEIEDFYKRLKDVTDVDGDYWGNPVYYSMLQMLQQAIEAVGSVDREAITEHMKTHTYQTITGELDMRDRALDRLWTVGQWQGDWFYGVAGVGGPGDPSEIRFKAGW